MSEIHAPSALPSQAPTVFVIDVDGVMTDGSFLYDADGKFAKRFSSDDHDALSLLRAHMDIEFITGDHRGFPISRRRIETDMKMPLSLVSTVERLDWISQRHEPSRVAYMGDGIFDAYVFQQVGYAISVADALDTTCQFAHYVTSRRGGDRAVAEAALHLLSTFFTPFDPVLPLPDGVHFSGHWSKGTTAPDPLAQAKLYFELFQARQLDQLTALFADDVTLVDWTVFATGKAEVVAAYGRILADLPDFELTVNTLERNANTVVADLTLALGNIALNVIDRLTFDSAGLIGSVKAYQGAQTPRFRQA